MELFWKSPGIPRWYLMRRKPVLASEREARHTFRCLNTRCHPKKQLKARNNKIKQGRMIERHGNSLKHAQENTQRSEARENVRDHERTRGETIETKQEPEKARVSFFPLLPLFVFSFVISSASRARYARLAQRARTKLQTNTNTKLHLQHTTAQRNTAQKTTPRHHPSNSSSC